MGFSDSSILVKVGAVLALVAFILVLVGLAVPAWVMMDVPGVGKFNIGLWQICHPGMCTPIPPEIADGQSQAAQAFVVLAMVVILVAMIFAILYVFAMTGKKIILFVVIGTCFAGGLFAIIGAACALAQPPMPGMKLGACGPLVIVSGVLAIGAGVMFVLDLMQAGSKGGSSDPEHAHGGSQAKVSPTA